MARPYLSCQCLVVLLPVAFGRWWRSSRDVSGQRPSCPATPDFPCTAFFLEWQIATEKTWLMRQGRWWLISTGNRYDNLLVWIGKLKLRSIILQRWQWYRRCDETMGTVWDCFQSWWRRQSQLRFFFITTGSQLDAQWARATPVVEANELLYENLVGGNQKSISSRGSKWTAILVGLPNFSPPKIWWPSI